MMIIRQNRYTVQAEYAAQNKEDIRRIMEELRALRRTDIASNIFVEDDGKTFIHLLFCANDEAEKVFFSKCRGTRCLRLACVRSPSA